MRVIKKPTLDKFAVKHSDAKEWLSSWYKIAKSVQWESLQDVRRQYPSVDDVQVDSGRWFLVFNVKGNRYRLIVGRDYSLGILRVKLFLTHAEYSKNKWKKDL